MIRFVFFCGIEKTWKFTRQHTFLKKEKKRKEKSKAAKYSLHAITIRFELTLEV